MKRGVSNCKETLLLRLKPCKVELQMKQNQEVINGMIGPSFLALFEC